MMKKDELNVEELENHKIMVRHNTTEEVEPETIIKIVEDIEKKIEEDKKTIEETTKNLSILTERLEKLQKVLPKAKLWTLENAKTAERAGKKEHDNTNPR